MGTGWIIGGFTPSGAWFRRLDNGIVGDNNKFRTERVWPVRGGPR